MNDYRTILLVEDNESDIELTKRAFNRKNILNEIIVVEDGQEALDFLFGNDKQPARHNLALILLDLKLPKIDGIEVLQRIRSNPMTKRIPVVILTSSREEEDLIASYDNGANSYIRKPIDFNRFVETVSQLGIYWLIVNEPSPK